MFHKLNGKKCWVIFVSWSFIYVFCCYCAVSGRRVWYCSILIVCYMWPTAWAPKSRSEVQWHLSHRLPAKMRGGWEGPEAAEESLWQETHLYHREICHHGPQQCHHLEWYSPQDQYGWWTTVVSTILVHFGSAEFFAFTSICYYNHVALMHLRWSFQVVWTQTFTKPLLV